jgi:hypothetical protein
VTESTDHSDTTKRVIGEYMALQKVDPEIIRERLRRIHAITRGEDGRAVTKRPDEPRRQLGACQTRYGMPSMAFRT